MARYRKTEVKTWTDQKFRRLSPMPPCGQGLWLWLLTGPRTTNVPGVVIGTQAALAAELGWSVKAFARAFGEVLQQGMARAESGIVWLPNATKYNRPESPNVIISWRDTWEEIPECQLKLEIYRHLKAFTEGLGETFTEAFTKAVAEPLTESGTGTGARTEAGTGTGKNARAAAFVAPTVEEVRDYCQSRGNSIDPEHFVASNQAKGWRTSKGTPIVDWRAAVITWEKNAPRFKNGRDPRGNIETLNNYLQGLRDDDKNK